MTGTSAFFDAIASMGDTQRGKPDPQVFLVAAAKLGVSPAHCVVLEDAVAGVQAARAGGMKCVGVSFVGHHSDAALHGAGANLVVKTLTELSVATVQQLCRWRWPAHYFTSNGSGTPSAAQRRQGARASSVLPAASRAQLCRRAVVALAGVSRASSSIEGWAVPSFFSAAAIAAAVSG